MEEFVRGYLNGYSDGRKGRRAQDYPNRDQYNAGYDTGYEDAIYHEKPDYNREDLKRIQRAENERLSYFAI